MRSAWKRKGVALAVAAASVAAAVTISASAVQAKPSGLHVSNEKALYVVQMLDLPVVAYDGSIKGLAATKPAAGQKIDPNSGKVAKYVAYLDGTHAAALARVGGRKVYDYRYSFNGFAAEMTEAAAMKLQGLPGVVAVSKDEIRQLDTSDTPEFLGLDGEGGVWQQLGGPTGSKSVSGAGENVIVGIVDSGIWPESASFSDRDANGKLAYQQIPGWHGKCAPGEAFDASMCNQKLIGAQYFNAGFGGKGFSYEFNSPRDADGHGTHTASTAAGNYGVDTGVVLAGETLGGVSGMAPRARVAAYKVCWGIAPDGGCASSDSVAAIDQAVADGVDVINFSISGSQNALLDPVEVAFLFAADAGVFVAASAGNDGPGAETLNHPSPWLTTVAASTHNRVAIASGSLGAGEDAIPLTGVGVASQTVSADLVYSGDVGLAGADPAEVALCYPGTLDPAEVTGKIVACDRGVIARVDKSAAVADAGGVGMFLMNVSPSSLNADNHVIPTLHVDENARAVIVDYIATTLAGGGNPTGTINAATITFDGTAEMASFSSRGPVFGGDFDVLKPDITAPGVDILAAVSPYSSGRDYDFLSGTSMSSPHMAGIGALMSQAFPGWSPMMIKSALMTTAYQEVTDAGEQADAFDFGAGHVAPVSALNPGLVYNSGFNEWLAFLCGTGQLQASYCPSIAIDPSNLNQASIAIGALAGSQTVTRTVTDVAGGGTYTAEIEGLDGIDVVVTTANGEDLVVAAGGSATYSLSFTTAGAPLGEYVTGSITWSDGNHSVRSPIVVRPVALAAPAEVSILGSDLTFEVGFGYTGPFEANVSGLVVAATRDDTVVDDPTDDIVSALGSVGQIGLDILPIDITAGTEYARFALFDDSVGNGSSDDLDLYVFDADPATTPVGDLLANHFLGGSGTGTSQEQVDLDAPAAGTVWVVVHGWQPAGGNETTYTLFTWLLDGLDAGNLAVDLPIGGATLGGTGEVTLTPTVDTGRWMGVVDFTDGTDVVGSTIVRVDRS